MGLYEVFYFISYLWIINVWKLNLIKYDIWFINKIIRELNFLKECNWIRNIQFFFDSIKMVQQLYCKYFSNLIISQR